MNSNEKSWGGYSTHSLPTRNAEMNITALLDIYAVIEKFDDPKVVDILMDNDYDTAYRVASHKQSKELIMKLKKHSSRVKLASDKIVRLILNEKRKNAILTHEPMFGDVIILLLLDGDFKDALEQAEHPKAKAMIIEVKNLYSRLINKLGLKMVI